MSGASLRLWGIRLPSSVSCSRFRRIRPPFSSFNIRRRRLHSICCKAAAVDKERVIVISGPTGAGKSRLALELAKRLNGEIISADSVQVYRGLDVGSAKPSSSERKEVPHHLLDILHPSEEYSVGQFYDDARQATRDILSRGRVPIVTGGTGLFIYGKPDVPKASREITSEVCAQLENYENRGDWDAAVQMLVEEGDPKAQSLPRNNWYRLRRSLEIIKSTGSPPSAIRVPYDSFRSEVKHSAEINPSDDKMLDDPSKDLDYDFTCFFLSSQRLDLYRSIDFRCEAMLSGSDGILPEAKWLLDIGLLPNTNSATRAIGYRQAMEYLLKCKEQGGGSASDFFTFLNEFQKASRNFAKRQMTWYRNELIYQWLDASKPLEKVLNFIYDAYHDTSGTLIVPESLQISKEITSSRQAAELKVYRPKNRYFLSRGDCDDILTWMRTEV
ncbi:hypothetical protein V2J09_018950 [Rumex salicifolius]